MTNQNQQPGNVTLDDLAEMVAKGFQNTATKEDIVALQTDIKRLDKEIQQLRGEIQAMSAKLTTYLELSDKRYLELKYKNSVIAKWVKTIADKTGVDIDLEELEKF